METKSEKSDINQLLDGDLVCDYCENIEPSRNMERCKLFASKHANSLTLYCETYTSSLDDQHSMMFYIWSCNKKHKITNKLSYIKSQIKEYGILNWCSICRRGDFELPEKSKLLLESYNKPKEKEPVKKKKKRVIIKD